MARPRVAVAASGGRDSTALLHCTLRQAQAIGIDVLALHVHHGLMPQADEWLAQVQQQARRWGATFVCRRLIGKPLRGQSVEAWARIERYRALAEMAAEAHCDIVLLAHHRRDQAETWLLQALRGAGSAGLSAMPALVQRQGLHWVRPWLGQPAEAIEAYGLRHRLKHAEDPSNADPRFARSRLRHAVWPVLSAAFADAELALAAAAGRAQEARALAQEAADADLPAITAGMALKLTNWQQLPPARRKNALRAWLQVQTGAAPAQTLLSRLMAELPLARQGSWPAPCGVLRLYRGCLTVEPASSPFGPTVAGAEPEPRLLDLSEPGQFAMPEWGGHWDVQAVTEDGIAAAHLRQVLVHARHGSERFRLEPRALPRSLKKQFQVRAVPAWQRQGPLLSTPTRQLLFVPGLGIDAAFRASVSAPVSAPQLRLRWVPATASTTEPHRRPG